jgi:hypothetical protein
MQQEQAGSVAYDATGRYNGAYNGVTLGQSGPDALLAAGYDGTSYTNVFSSALASAFNGNTGSALAWACVGNMSVWSDGINRRVIYVAGNTANRFSITRSTTDNALQLFYISGGVIKSLTWTITPNLTWHVFAISWDKNADQVCVYLDGVRSSTVFTGLGVWSATIIQADIGRLVDGQKWLGQIGPVALYDRALTAQEVASLSKI